MAGEMVSQLRSLASLADELGLSFWHLHGGSQLPITPVVENLIPSLAFHGHSHT